MREVYLPKLGIWKTVRDLSGEKCLGQSMSESGQKATSARAFSMSGPPPAANIIRPSAQGRFVPTRKLPAYSITRSAITKRLDGISIPNALAVWRFINSWNFVGCSIGKSAGLAPLKILLTKTAAVRKTSS